MVLVSSFLCQRVRVLILIETSYINRSMLKIKDRFLGNEKKVFIN